MARYVKTSDGYIGKVENTKVYIKDEWFSINDIRCFFIRQADTIEELCDCFVTEGNRHIVWDKQQNKGITFEQVKESFTAYHFKIYGAIWTEWGLKYVAKMDDKGELKLI